MKHLGILSLSLLTAATLTASCGRHIRMAKDITPGNMQEDQLTYKYGANDIRIQTTKINKQLMDRWYFRTHYDGAQGKPRIVVTQIENRTDTYIPSDVIRDIIEAAAINDGRYSILVGDAKDEQELDQLMNKIQNDPKYANVSRLEPNQAKAPQFLAKIHLTKTSTELKRSTIEDYRMSVTLYDVQTQEAIDQAYDVLRKQVEI
jgi:Peptidoglycan-synthase activator LpoB